jgi:RimJ/RimL family protein N-acetyltransferase
MDKNTTQYIPIQREHINYRIKWLNDPEINRYLCGAVRSGTDREFHKKWFDNYEAEEKENKRKIFMIKINNEFVGQVGLLDIDKSEKKSFLYIAIGEKKYWGRGIATEAIKYIHDFAFHDLGLHKINLYVHTANTRAIALYEKIGYKHVGIFHDNVCRDGKFEDESLMEIINRI